jgi:hypothetical protein
MGTVLLGWGTWWLVRHGGDNRFLGVVIVALLLLVWIAQLRRNYLGGVYPLGIAVGAVQLELATARRWWHELAKWPAIAVSVLVLAPGLVPLGHGWLGGVTRFLLPDHRSDWHGLASAVAGVTGEVPASDRLATVVIAGDYWRASVLYRLREQYSLPPVYGDMQGSWYFGPPPAGTRSVVFVGTLPEALRPHCGGVRLSRWFVDPHDSPLSVEVPRTPIYVCGGITIPMDRLWPRLQHTTLRT